MLLFDDTEMFNSGGLKVTKFDIPDAELTLWEHFFPRAEADKFYNKLLHESPWKQETIVIHGETKPYPRLITWYGKLREGTAPDFTPELRYIKAKVEEATSIQFTSVLLNLYRNGQDSVTWHRDHDRELGPAPPVASVSFGETRPFEIRHKFRKDLDKIRIPLNHGSLLLMAGPMQHHWEHQIPKTKKELKPRINLTFRIY
jgi:alkylated DNA repair dioxygenase AlkB